MIKCKYCNNPIFWVKMAETGFNMPLSAKKDGTPKKTVGIQVNMETMTGFKTDVYQPHFGKCTPVGRKAHDKIYKDTGTDQRKGVK